MCPFKQLSFTSCNQRARRLTVKGNYLQVLSKTGINGQQDHYICLISSIKLEKLPHVCVCPLKSHQSTFFATQDAMCSVAMFSMYRGAGKGMTRQESQWTIGLVVPQVPWSNFAIAEILCHGQDFISPLRKHLQARRYVTCLHTRQKGSLILFGRLVCLSRKFRLLNYSNARNECCGLA